MQSFDYRVKGALYLVTGSCHRGAAGWTLEGDPGPITACNRTLCRRYGALWAYDFESERIRLTGSTIACARGQGGPGAGASFLRDPRLRRVLAPPAPGRRRPPPHGGEHPPAPPDAVADLAVDHLDGFETFDDLPGDGRRVRDLWF